MATTKDYLRLAILGGGSKGACISDTKVSISPDASAGQSSSYATTTAPFDGVVSFGLVATETNQNGAGPWFSVSGKNNRQNLNASWFQTGGSWSFIPCRKGEKITYGGSGVKFTVIDFYKSIGGGYKRYLKALACNRFGGSLWLRLKTTSETLQKQEACLPLRREGGFLTRLLSTRVVECGDKKPLLQLASSLSSLSAQTSVTLISKTRLHMPILAGHLSAIAQERATCHVTRAMRSRTTLGAQTDKPQTQVPLRSTSFLLSVASNNARMEVAA